MATVTELWKSRNEDESQVGEKSSASKNYLVETNLSSETEVDAIAAVKSAASSTYLGFDRKNVKLTTVHGAGIFEYEVTYDSKETKKLDDTSFSFDIADITEKVYYSLTTKDHYERAGWTAVDFKNGINVTPHGVEGADLGAQGAVNIEVSKIMAAADVGTYFSTIFPLRGCINDSSWTLNAKGVAFTFLEGEARFVGCRGQWKQDNGLFEITLKFACNKTIAAGDALVVGGISVTDKRGWDYLWIYYRQTANGGAVVQEAKQVNIEAVFRDGDFDGFGL